MVSSGDRLLSAADTVGRGGTGKYILKVLMEVRGNENALSSQHFNTLVFPPCLSERFFAVFVWQCHLW